MKTISSDYNLYNILLNNNKIEKRSYDESNVSSFENSFQEKNFKVYKKYNRIKDKPLENILLKIFPNKKENAVVDFNKLNNNYKEHKDKELERIYDNKYKIIENYVQSTREIIQDCELKDVYLFKNRFISDYIYKKIHNNTFFDNNRKMINNVISRLKIELDNYEDKETNIIMIKNRILKSKLKDKVLTERLDLNSCKKDLIVNNNNNYNDNFIKDLEKDRYTFYKNYILGKPNQINFESYKLINKNKNKKK